jgi:peptidoglycan hydrolase-like protein with peptidoglycan-binding domain
MADERFCPNNGRMCPSNIAKQMKIGWICLLIWLASTAAGLADQSIADVQESLKNQGFYYGQITGQKDADTTAAIRRYQIRNGLQITGDLDDETLRSIKSGGKTTAQSSPAPASPPLTTPPDASDLRIDPAPHDQGFGSVPVQPQPQPDTNQFQQRPAPGRPVTPENGIFSGTPYEMAPPEVQRRVIADVQRTLARWGLFKDQVNGVYGPALEFSLRAYQSRVGLMTTGRLDLETLAALQLLPGSHLPIYTPRRPMVGPELPPVRGEWVRP